MSTKEFPVLLGAKYFVIGKTIGIYIAAELAVATISSGLSASSNTDTNLGFTAGAGIKQGPVDLRFQLFSPSFKDFSNLHSAMITLGVDIFGI